MALIFLKILFFRILLNIKEEISYSNTSPIVLKNLDQQFIYVKFDISSSPPPHICLSV